MLKVEYWARLGDMYDWVRTHIAFVRVWISVSTNKTHLFSYCHQQENKINMKTESWFIVQAKKEIFRGKTFFSWTTVIAKLEVEVNNLTVWCRGEQLVVNSETENRYKLSSFFDSCHPLNYSWYIKDQNRMYKTGKRNQFQDVMKQIKGKQKYWWKPGKICFRSAGPKQSRKTSSAENKGMCFTWLNYLVNNRCRKRK